ncbi:MAG: BPSL0067 family protein [Gemmataceae bacterium]
MRFRKAVLAGVVVLVAGVAQASYICKSPSAYSGKTVGSGQCVPFVQEAAGAPHTSKWKQGVQVRGNKNLARGTAIASGWANGAYPNKATGNHAAIYDGQDDKGIWVYDQWAGKKPKPVSRRHIPFRGGKGSPSNDGDAFYVIESK